MCRRGRKEYGVYEEENVSMASEERAKQGFEMGV